MTIVYDINKQTIYSAKTKNRIKGILCPRARTGPKNNSTSLWKSVTNSGIKMFHHGQSVNHHNVSSTQLDA